MSNFSVDSNQKLDGIEPTDEWLTSRGGLSLYHRYLKRSGLLDRLETRFGYLRKIDKGLSVREAFRQLLCFFADGTGQHLVDFDRLKREEGYAGTLETAAHRLGSSHAFKRFFQAFSHVSMAHFRPLFRELFVRRLNQVAPEAVVLFMDTMILENDDATQREGVEPTYQGTCGFQPFQIFWNGLPVDAVFRGGSKHSNHGETARKALEHLIEDICTGYDDDVPIVVRFDSGFFDQQLFEFLEENEVGYVATGKAYEDLKQYVRRLPDEAFETMETKDAAWEVAEFGDGRGSWERFRRTVYTRPICQNAQRMMSFHPADRFYYTNLGMGFRLDSQMREAGHADWLEPKGVVHLAHERGTDELNHRRLKEFGWETLPFQNFEANMALYYVMLLSFFTFQTFQRDVGEGIFPDSAYPRTIRRRWIDVAGKVVRHAGRRVLKIARSAYESLQFERLWKRCNAPPALV